MKQALYNLTMRGGEKVALLFSPRLYEFKGSEGVTFDFIKGDAASLQALYADVMYCAALNHWTLTHTGDEQFPYKRIDFHAYSVEDRNGFGKAMIFAMEALSGKSVRELLESAGKGEETGKDPEVEVDTEDGVKKKSRRGWITRLLSRS